MKIEKLNKDNIKEFIKDMKLDNTDNLEYNVDKCEFYGIKKDVNTENMGFFSAALFGMIFSIGWTPCVGAFLGSALMLASTQAHMVKGVLMLLSYSLGLGIPFIVSAVLIDKLKGAFNFIKSNYEIINKISGAFLILVGLSMATGLLGRLLSLLS